MHPRSAASTIAVIGVLNPEVNDIIAPLVPVEASPRLVQFPARELACALIQCGVEDAIGQVTCVGKDSHNHARASKRLQQRAIAWIMSDDRSYPTSFLNLCDFVNVEAQPIRNRVYAALTSR